ncbi:MAG: MFS transporter, partial [Pelagibacterales bacterium]|nr:MFS transporter [Pelagibacterales bacterium]
MMQSLIFAVYPILKTSLNLTFSQIGIIGFVYQITASLLQPIVGIYTDKSHKPYSLVFGMFCTLFGLFLLAFAKEFYLLLIAVSIIGTGSSVFHPEASRVARMSGKGKHGFSQSFFQVGGNLGTAIGPLLAAFIILKKGQESIVWFCFAAFFGMILLTYVGRWFDKVKNSNQNSKKHLISESVLPKKKIAFCFF